MRRIVMLVISATVIGFTAYVGFMIMTTRSHSPEETVNYNDSDIQVSVTYCRPYKKGRKIFGGMISYGDYWRTGANDATEIEFSEPVIFGNQQVAAGRYRLYTFPNINQWQVVLNSELGQWGAFKPNSELDVAKIIVPVRVLPSEVEQFTILIEKSGEVLQLFLKWEKTEIIIPIELVQS